MVKGSLVGGTLEELAMGLFFYLLLKELGGVLVGGVVGFLLHYFMDFIICACPQLQPILMLPHLTNPIRPTPQANPPINITRATIF